MCSSSLEAIADIGPAGGVVSLPPVRLLIPKGALSRMTTIRLARLPLDRAHPFTCSYRDVYTVEPFLLASAVNKPFRFFWLMDSTALSRTESLGAICPKVSWSDDPARSPCYSLAGMPRTYHVGGSFVSNGKQIFQNKHYIRDFTYPDRREGCIPVAPKRHERVSFVEFEFLAGRLGHFRLLPQTDDERDLKVDNFRKPGSTYSTPEGLCRFVPETSRRSIHFVEGMGDEDMFWETLCKANDQCEDGMWCFMPDCKGIGFCVDQPTDCSHGGGVSPVCGCDGITYRNFCEAEKLGVSWRSFRPCPSQAPDVDTGDSNE